MKPFMWPIQEEKVSSDRFPKDMGILSTNVGLSNEINLPGYDVKSEPEAEDIQTLVSYIKEAERPVILAGAGINHSKI